MTAPNSEFEITKTESEGHKNLTPEQFHVLRRHETERAYTSPLDKQYKCLAPFSHIIYGIGMQPLKSKQHSYPLSFVSTVLGS